MKRTLIILALLGSALTSKASYELMIVADAGTQSVHRFDPVTGQYFGSFGAGLMSGLSGMAIYSPTSTAFVLEAGGTAVSAWNYHTGEYLDTYTYGIAATNIGVRSDGSLFLVTPETMYRAHPGGAIVRTWTAPGDFRFTCASGGPSDKQLFGMNSPTQDTQASWVAGDGELFSAGNWGWTTQEAMRSVAVTDRATAVGFASSLFGYNHQTDGYVWNGTGLNVGAVGVGHGRMIYGAGRELGNPSVAYVQRWDVAANLYRGRFGMGILSDPVGMGVVVAPEPSSLFALGGLAVGLAARRRRKSAK